MLQFTKAYDFYFNNSPLLVMTPHSGRDYNKRFLKYIKLKLNEIRNTEDFYVDQLFLPNINEFSYLNAKFPRVIVDVNRSPLEIDATMWENNNLKTLFNSKSSKVINGIGVFAKYNLYGKYLYSSKIPFNEAKWRLLNYYFPYHKKIKEILHTNKNKYEEVIALDCHSMSSALVNNEIDIVISNGDNKTSSKELINLVKNSFKKYSYNTRLNSPFKGGFISTYYGNPSKKIHFIQIEINKKIYMNENNMKLRNNNFLQLKDCFDNVIKDILRYLYN